jgi:hypothetical protein
LRLPPQAVELLSILVRERPNVVAKENLIEQLWPDVSVEEANVRNLVAEIRAALGDDDHEPRFIRTAHRVGYAFIAPTVTLSARLPRLIGPTTSYMLAEGTNIIGREEDCAVPLDSQGVSRHHAKIMIASGSATLEDLGSKNSTWLNGQRIEGPAELRHGDKIRLGTTTLTFRSSHAAETTSTLDSPEA